MRIKNKNFFKISSYFVLNFVLYMALKFPKYPLPQNHTSSFTYLSYQTNSLLFFSTFKKFRHYLFYNFNSITLSHVIVNCTSLSLLNLNSTSSFYSRITLSFIISLFQFFFRYQQQYLSTAELKMFIKLNLKNFIRSCLKK